VLLTYATLGFRHIADIRALDHLLFLVALAAVYRPRDWRAVLWVVSAFTLGHSLTLALSATNVLVPPAALVEFVIPLTIVVTGVANIAAPPPRAGRAWTRPVLAGVFGLVHGAGFAGYLRAMLLDDIAVPLLGFNLGVEAGQVVILTAAFAALAAVDRVLAAMEARGLPGPALRWRAVAVSSLVTLVAAQWTLERAPW
jgi:hypothetical protein